MTTRILGTAVLCLTLFIAGCAAPGETSPSSPDALNGKAPSESDLNATLLAPFHGNYTVGVKAVENGIGWPPFQNCISVVKSGGDMIVSNVTAIATWSSPLPTRFALAYAEGPGPTKTVNGTSGPLTLHVGGTRLVKETAGLFDIMVFPAPPTQGNVSPATFVDIELSFNYEVGRTFEVWYGTCGS